METYQQLLWYWIDQRISGFWAANIFFYFFFIVFVSLFSAALLAIALKLDTLFETTITRKQNSQILGSYGGRRGIHC